MTSAPLRTLAPSTPGNQFGTFGGVFTPSILTILGVVMFMLAGFVVGQAGILRALLILVIAKGITLLTTVSISAISTNLQVRGGGAYYLISRVLGPEFGGAIGIALFFAQALSVPFYILGFTAALTETVPALEPHFTVIAFTTALLLFTVAWIGAGWAIRVQYLIMACLVLALLTLLGGGLLLFRWSTFAANWGAGYTALAEGGGEHLTFWRIFAIYFPAVTGITAGLNMSGDLRDPARSIPLGTFAAIAVGGAVYMVQILVMGGAFPRAELIARPFGLLKDNALFGLSALVVAGVFAATLSSALGSLLGAPRILQAVARDRILPFLAPFAAGTARGDEPRRGILLTLLLTVLVLAWAGASGGGAALALVASVITMFFLYTYGMMNLAAFVEAFGENPSFRPRFRYFHWLPALAGAFLCVAVAFLIEARSAAVAVLVVGLLLWGLQRRHLATAFGDARRGFVFASLRRSLLRIGSLPEDPRNWRPTILAFSGNPKSRETLATYSVWLESGRGIAYFAHLIIGPPRETFPRRLAAEKQLGAFCREKGIQAFPVVAACENLDTGVSLLLQTGHVGPVRPNVAVFGWPGEPSTVPGTARRLRVADDLDMSLVLIRDGGLPGPGEARRIDVWWRGRANGELMLMLAHLLTRNWEWSGAGIRVLRMVEREAGREPARAALEELIVKARVRATAEVLVNDRPFPDVLRNQSRDATCVVLGFDLPPEGAEAAWHTGYRRLLEGLPTTLLIHACAERDLLV